MLRNSKLTPISLNKHLRCTQLTSWMKAIEYFLRAGNNKANPSCAFWLSFFLPWPHQHVIAHCFLKTRKKKSRHTSHWNLSGAPISGIIRKLKACEHGTYNITLICNMHKCDALNRWSEKAQIAITVRNAAYRTANANFPITKPEKSRVQCTSELLFEETPSLFEKKKQKFLNCELR